MTLAKMRRRTTLGTLIGEMRHIGRPKHKAFQYILDYSRNLLFLWLFQTNSSSLQPWDCTMELRSSGSYDHVQIYEVSKWSYWSIYLSNIPHIFGESDPLVVFFTTYRVDAWLCWAFTSIHELFLFELSLKEDLGFSEWDKARSLRTIERVFG